jgi:hypothetical protein
MYIKINDERIIEKTPYKVCAFYRAAADSSDVGLETCTFLLLATQLRSFLSLQVDLGGHDLRFFQNYFPKHVTSCSLCPVLIDFLSSLLILAMPMKVK